MLYKLIVEVQMKPALLLIIGLNIFLIVSPANAGKKDPKTPKKTPKVRPSRPPMTDVLGFLKPTPPNKNKAFTVPTVESLFAEQKEERKKLRQLLKNEKQILKKRERAIDFIVNLRKQRGSLKKKNDQLQGQIEEVKGQKIKMQEGKIHFIEQENSNGYLSSALSFIIGGTSTIAGMSHFLPWATKVQESIPQTQVSFPHMSEKFEALTTTISDVTLATGGGEAAALVATIAGATLIVKASFECRKIFNTNKLLRSQEKVLDSLKSNQTNNYMKNLQNQTKPSQIRPKEGGNPNVNGLGYIKVDPTQR